MNLKKIMLIFSMMLTLMIIPFVANKGLEEKALDKQINYYMDIKPGDEYAGYLMKLIKWVFLLSIYFAKKAFCFG